MARKIESTEDEPSPLLFFFFYSVDSSVIVAGEIYMFKQRCMDEMHSKIKEWHDLQGSMPQAEIKKMTTWLMGNI